MPEHGGATAAAPALGDVVASADTLRSAVRDFLAAERRAGGFEPRCDSWLVGFDRAFSRRLAAAGFVGITLPTLHGGAGLSPLHRFVVIEELLAAGAPVAAHWFAERQIGPALVKHGTRAQQEEWIPRIVRGEASFAVGLSEPGAGSDLAAVRTSATKVDGGWTVQGTKLWSSNAHHADAIVALTRTEAAERKHQGLTQLIVRLPDPTVAVNPIISLDGGHHFNEVVFDRTFVPDDMVLGVVGQGWSQVVSELAFERSGPERYLSTMPLLQQLVSELPDAAVEAEEELGALLAELATLREMSLDVARAMGEQGGPDPVAASVVKDLGTRFEIETVAVAERLARLVETPSPVLRRLLATARLQSPGFTLRGGTVEILRGIIAKGLVR